MVTEELRKIMIFVLRPGLLTGVRLK